MSIPVSLYYSNNHVYHWKTRGNPDLFQLKKTTTKNKSDIQSLKYCNGQLYLIQPDGNLHIRVF